MHYYKVSFETRSYKHKEICNIFYYNSQGEDREVDDFSGEVQNDLRGGAHLPPPPLKIRP